MRAGYRAVARRVRRLAQGDHRSWVARRVRRLAQGDHRSLVARGVRVRRMTVRPRLGAPSLISTACAEAGGDFGLTKPPNMAVPGKSSSRRLSRFDSRSVVIKWKPVAFPPGRFRLATKPDFTGSLLMNTIGMVEVAAFAVRAEASPPAATSTVTL